MYKRHLNQINLLDEPEYFGGIALDPDNEWVKLAKLIPWHQFEEEYATTFSSGTGQPACSFRIALGSLLIKERYQFSDEETVAQHHDEPVSPVLYRFGRLHTEISV